MSREGEIEELRKRQALARDSRRLLCEFIGVCASSIQPGPPSYGHRP